MGLPGADKAAPQAPAAGGHFDALGGDLHTRNETINNYVSTHTIIIAEYVR